MSEFRLPGDGDKIELRAWPLFGKEKFPNYEKFWQIFVVPRTNRIYDRTNIHPREDISDEECELMSMHWQILANFDFIYRKMDKISGKDKVEKEEEACDLFDHA